MNSPVSLQLLRITLMAFSLNFFPEIRCDPPLIVDKYLFYQCPDGYSYGATCQLQCMGSFPLIGNDTITCERNDSYAPPRGYWEMGESQPYCSSTNHTKKNYFTCFIDSALPYYHYK